MKLKIVIESMMVIVPQVSKRLREKAEAVKKSELVAGRTFGDQRDQVTSQ